jgi:hypothetical protein
MDTFRTNFSRALGPILTSFFCWPKPIRGFDLFHRCRSQTPEYCLFRAEAPAVAELATPRLSTQLAIVLLWVIGEISAYRRRYCSYSCQSLFRRWITAFEGISINRGAWLVGVSRLGCTSGVVASGSDAPSRWRPWLHCLMRRSLAKLGNPLLIL